MCVGLLMSLTVSPGCGRITDTRSYPFLNRTHKASSFPWNKTNIRRLKMKASQWPATIDTQNLLCICSCQTQRSATYLCQPRWLSSDIHAGPWLSWRSHLQPKCSHKFAKSRFILVLGVYPHPISGYFLTSQAHLFNFHLVFLFTCCSEFRNEDNDDKFWTVTRHKAPGMQVPDCVLNPLSSYNLLRNPGFTRWICKYHIPFEDVCNWLKLR